MAETFLAQLPTIQKKDWPEDTTCMICKEAYGTAAFGNSPGEAAVLLPCGHFCGFDCLSSWLSTNLNRNSCPYCRRKLFAFTTRVEAEVLLLQGHPRQISEDFNVLNSLMSWSWARESREVLERWLEWLDSWALALHHVDQARIEHARVARGELLTRIGWSEVPRTDYRGAVLWSETASTTDFLPLARAIQTLRFRELWLYLHFRIRNNPDSIEEHILDAPTRTLSTEKEEWLFEQLMNEGAFGGVLEEMTGEQEKWQVLRSQGYSWDTSDRLWTPRPSGMA